MKRNMIFVAFRLSVLPASYRWMHTALVPLLMLVIAASSANAQSKERTRPTRLTSDKISLSFDETKSGDNYHYEFMAGPGEVTIKFTLERGGMVTQAEFELFDDTAKKLGGKYITCCVGGSTEQAVVRINVTRRQLVLLRIILHRAFGSGKLDMEITGAVQFNRTTSGIDASGFNDYEKKKEIVNPECLPAQGTLIVRMKDGSKKIIDLSEAEAITIVP